MILVLTRLTGPGRVPVTSGLRGQWDTVYTSYGPEHAELDLTGASQRDPSESFTGGLTAQDLKPLPGLGPEVHFQGGEGSVSHWLARGLTSSPS